MQNHARPIPAGVGFKYEIKFAKENETQKKKKQHTFKVPGGVHCLVIGVCFIFTSSLLHSVWNI